MRTKSSQSVQQFMSQGRSNFVRIPPEPESRLGIDFRSILSGVGGIAATAATSGIGGSIDPKYLSLINKQIEMQEQVQLVSLTSNVEKSRHESKMAAIRNIRSA